MDKQFVDTGAFIAITDKSDQYHSKATAYFRKLLKLRHPLLTTNFVLDETYTRLKRKLGSKASITFGDEIRKSDQLDPDGHFKIPHLWPGQNTPATG